MNLPNLLTLSRIPMMFIISALLLGPVGAGADWAKWLAFALFVVAALTDWLDGYLARKLNQISEFGKLMDALTDKILMVGLFVTMLSMQLLPKVATFGVIIMVGREFIITGLRMVAASAGVVLAAEASGKYKTAFQMIATTLLLLALALDLSPRWLYQGGIACFWASVALTVYSGIFYLTKYWSLFTGQEPKKS